MSKGATSWLRKTKSIVLLGLETAGKTTLVNGWARGITSKTTTTIGLDIEHVEVGNEIFNLIDLGGQQAFRVTLWKTYAQMAQAILFVFDITDSQRTKDAVKWFWQVEEWVQSGIPIMFCANKIDLKKEKGGDKEAMSLEEIIKTFDLQRFGSELEAEHSFRIFETSALTGENVDKAMEWIFNRLQKKADAPDIRKLTIGDLTGKIICDIAFVDEAELRKEDVEIKNIIKMNIGISESHETIQFFESTESIKILISRDKHLCLVSAPKKAEYNSLRIVAETILSLFLTQLHEFTYEEDMFKEILLGFFSKPPE
ncbi:MAG: GTP-binding protein [Candidatus Heimdallarchaeota archaeon]|nr:MAG: GTP-binding protein [Candidatus Heimdallarchaeota archaeon]